MHFVGAFKHTIDAKHRLQLPAEIRSKVDPKALGSEWVIGPGPTGLLRLWPARTFDQMLTQICNDPLPDEATATLTRLLHRHSRRAELDGAGRLRIPEELLRSYGLGSSVVVLGAGDAIELMDVGAYESEEALAPASARQVWTLAARARHERRQGGEGR